MNQYPWLKEYLDQWFGLIHTNKVPHAILLSGSRGLAKKELAQNMAHIAVCENLSESDVCNNCKGCHLFNSGNHTDIQTIAAEKEVIKVDQIRQLSKNVVLSSTRNKYRITIIEDAEKMNKASANALLKTLEEPPEGVIIILTTSEIGHLLPTIKSRCFKIGIAAVDHAQLRKYIQSCNLGSNEDLEMALLLANYAPKVAIGILENQTLLTVKSMLTDLNMIATHQKTILDVTNNWLKNELIDYLNLIANYFLCITKYENGIDQNQSYLNLSSSDYSKINDKNNKSLNFIRSIFTFIKRQKTSLKIELLLEELLISWKNDFQN